MSPKRHSCTLKFHVSATSTVRIQVVSMCMVYKSKHLCAACVCDICALLQAGMRPRSSLPVLGGYEFLDPAVTSCLQWAASQRPTAEFLSKQLSLGSTHAPAFTNQAVAPGPPPGGWAKLGSSKSLGSASVAYDAEAPHTATGLAPRSESSSQLTLPIEKPCGSGSMCDSQTSPQPTFEPRGNKLLGKCEAPGCINHRIRSTMPTCWRHIPTLLPNELKVAEALQTSHFLEHLYPCDLVAATMWARAALKHGMVALAIICFLKVPGAIGRFMDVLNKSAPSAASAKTLVAGLRAALAPKDSQDVLV